MVFLPTWMLDFMVNVGKYAIHGSYGSWYQLATIKASFPSSFFEVPSVEII